MKRLWGSAAMIAATLIWGVSFSAQSTAMRWMDPLPFTALRSLVGMLALALTTMIFDLVRERRLSFWGRAESAAERRELLTGGLWCGVVIAAASVSQQYGIKYTSAGKAGFLTALYIVIVPVLGLLFFKRKTGPALWFAVLLALTGSYLLCGGISSIGKGEIFVIVCALIYSVHILVIDRYAAKCDCVRLSCLQFLVASVITLGASPLVPEPWVLENVVRAMPFWLFCGVGSSAVAFTLQMVAQKYLHPVTATLLMSLESVFAVLGGWLFLHEMLSARELTGCAVIFSAVILSQLPRKTPQA
ncbi:MAG: DMT family transporter [Lentisphaeria bacterium]|nr:DMT family transporter [Lentisphaeria bacterium]